MSAPLWSPSPDRVAAAQLTAFRRAMSTANAPLPDYRALHRWSVEQPGRFWRAIWDLGAIEGTPGATVLAPGAPPRGARWFPDARLSFAASLLRGDPARPAIVALREGGSRRELSRGQLRREVARWTAALRASGVRPGDRVGAWLPNGPEAVTAMLATAALGAIWSSCSPDFGPQGVLDRLGPLAPRVLVATDGHVYRAKRHARLDGLDEIVRGLPSLERVVVVPWLDEGRSLPGEAIDLRAFLAEHDDGAAAPLLPAWPFETPLYVLFSSGTTGKPKCIVHGAGGVLLQHVKEHRLHCDIRPGDRVFFHTTCGWMMWNWLVSALASEATIVLYDGDPLVTRTFLLETAARERLTFLGSSAAYFDVLRKEGVRPPAPLADLRTLASTGSPLAPETFAFLYRAIAPDAHLASISGGTDLVSCFALGDPTAPVYAGELQVPGLGMAVDVLDEEGRSRPPGTPGELVCRPPFPTMPLGFWGDEDGRAYRRAYFERFDGLWCHGDWAEWSAHGGLVIHGRSDATLNVGGVRIGTAEITREVLAQPEVLEALAVECALPGQEGIALFVRLRPDAALDEPLRERIRGRLRERMSPRHVPRHLVAVADLPRTRSGKLSELAVREVLHGRRPRNTGALANPESLDGIGL